MSHSNALVGKTALVTGAGRGIGRRVSEAFAESGAQVFCLARSEDVVRELAGRIGGEPLAVDLTDDLATWDALDGVREALGAPPDIVVNAAGVFGIESCATETVKAFDLSLAVNLRGAFIVNRALLPAMLQRARGLIINVGSVAGRQAFQGNAAYSASKYGLRGYHEVLLQELRGTGVRATLLEPSATDTSMWDPLAPDEDPDLPGRDQMLDPADVAHAALFVATRPDTVRIPLLQIERA